MSDYFISRDGQRLLVSLLREIPELLVHLNAVITNQERVGSGGPRVSTGEKEQPLPFDARASEAGAALHAELAYWVRWTCEPRGITYWPVDYTHTFDFIGPLRDWERRIPSADFRDTTVGLVMWLDRHVVALAMTEGAEDAFDYIEAAVNAVRKVATLPKERVRPASDVEMEAARGLQLNVDTIARLSKALGGPCKKLTKRRINYLWKEAHVVEPIRTSNILGNPIFLFGDVVDAHVGLLAKASA